MGLAGFSCRLEFNSINDLHASSTAGTINPQAPYCNRYFHKEIQMFGIEIIELLKVLSVVVVIILLFSALLKWQSLRQTQSDHFKELQK